MLMKQWLSFKFVILNENGKGREDCFLHLYLHLEKPNFWWTNVINTLLSYICCSII